jgi:hypothetical protein
MSGSTAAVIVIPIVVAIVLFGWLTAVLRADTHPRYRHRSRLPKYEVTGGAFEANDGGRQVMPIPGSRPMIDRPGYDASDAIPAQRTGASAPSGATVPAQAGAGQQGSARQQGPAGQRAESAGETGAEQHLAAGSKLR